MKNLAIACLLLCSCASFAQDRPTITAQANTVFVGADGKFEADPDTAVVQFNISVQKDKSREAYDRAAQAAEQVRQTLRSNSIDPKSAQIGTFSIQPVFDYKQEKPRIVAYQVSASVTVKLKDFGKIAPILQQLSDADVAGSEHVSYTLENMDAAKSKAVEDAYRRARESAETVAKAGGRTLGDLSYASVDTFENVRVAPMVMGMAKTTAMTPAPTEEFSPQTVTVTAHVNAMFTLK